MVVVAMGMATITVIAGAVEVLLAAAGVGAGALAGTGVWAGVGVWDLGGVTHGWYQHHGMLACLVAGGTDRTMHFQITTAAQYFIQDF